MVAAQALSTGSAKNPRVAPTQPAKSNVDRTSLTRVYSIRLFQSDATGHCRAMTLHEADSWRNVAQGRDCLLWDVQDGGRVIDLSAFPDPESHLPDFASSKAGPEMRAAQFDSSDAFFVSVVGSSRTKLAVYKAPETPGSSGS